MLWMGSAPGLDSACNPPSSQIAYKTGDKKKAEQLAKHLMPDEEKKAKGIIKWAG